jgi:hypothetical protein
MFAIAISKAKSWRGESAMRVTAKKLELAEAQAERLATATEAHPVRNPANQETLPAPISQAM